MLASCFVLFFFFFQAEDGIRDKLVTGVQTCTLPIYMKQVLASVGIALLVAGRPAAAQERTIDWSRTAVTGGVTLPGEGRGGAAGLQLRSTGPTSFHLVPIERPAVTGPAYAVTGQGRYQGLEGQ